MNSTKCEICGRTKNEVSILIQGSNGLCLCNECIRLYDGLLNDYSWVAKETKQDEQICLMKPHEIKKELDKRVIGQDNAKIALSVAVYNHLLYFSGKLKKYRKSNILLIGSTGVGKTLLVESLAKIVDIPFVTCDATTYSEVGYVGNDVNQILELLYYNSDSNIERMQKGIVFLDEIDKIGAAETGHSYGRDVSGAGVQQALLKMIEGKRVSLDIYDQGIKKAITVDTSKILFVFSGAFVGANYNEPLDESLIQFGMLPEFIGRANYIIKLNDLSKADLVHIMRDVDDSLCEMYEEMFKADDIELAINTDALETIAEIAIAKNLGARGLFAIFAKLLGEIRYKSISNKVGKIMVTSEVVRQLFLKNNVLKGGE